MSLVERSPMLLQRCWTAADRLPIHHLFAWMRRHHIHYHNFCVTFWFLNSRFYAGAKREHRACCCCWKWGAASAATATAAALLLPPPLLLLLNILDSTFDFLELGNQHFLEVGKCLGEAKYTNGFDMARPQFLCVNKLIKEISKVYISYRPTRTQKRYKK